MKEQVLQAFLKRYGKAPERIARAPGRLEILGNHTDYNQGTVLSAAIDRYTWVAVSLEPGNKCQVYSLTMDEERVFSMDELEKRTPGDWCNYVKGMILAMAEFGVTTSAFRMVIGSNVPLSAGMSSSAALEMAIITALKGGEHCPGLEALTKARIGQACENHYIGAQTGLMDQFSSLNGKADCLIHSDFHSLKVNAIPIPAGTAFVVVNCMVKHNLTTEYNDRRAACEDAVKRLASVHPGLSSLRFATLEELLSLEATLAPETFHCARHVIREIARVEDGVAALQANRLADFGQLMFQSHESSRDDFRNSCAELDLLVEIGRHTPGCLGARLSGGGFGGITVHLVQAEQAERYAKSVAAEYQARTSIAPQTFLCHAADGATVL
ncbi:MAG: galactokinase [Victivallales bacterium]|nr:galactokinase [Victivallales bacterium]